MLEQNSHKSPWLWIPTLYFVEGLPYFIVNTISIVMFKDFGMDNGTLALITSLISLPWVIKPLWSPFVDIIRTKRWWILAMQILMVAAVLLVALSTGLSGGSFVPMIIFFVIAAFASATHDIASDGFYMLGLGEKSQSAFVGIRNTFYRVSMVFGQGVLVVIAGILQRRLGDAAKAWQLTLVITGALLLAFNLWHFRVLPHPVEDADKGRKTAAEIFREFGGAFGSFFSKKAVWIAIAFMLLYRLPEAFSVKMLYPFFSDSLTQGGLELSKEAYGILYGTAGVIALLTGGILGGLHIAKRGLKACILPMCLLIALPCSVYLFMAIAQPSSLWTIGTCIVLDQFGYGYGFTAYTVFMMYFAAGPMKTSHYALCTGFMALSMMLPGLVAGYLQQALGYVGFFILVMVCCVPSVLATLAARRQIKQ